MAYLGSDGSEGKEGKDDSAIRSLLNSLEGFDPEVLLPEGATESRRFAEVTLKGTQDLPEERRKLSERYWQQADQYGLIDSRILQEEGDTILVLSVCDEEEARRLVENDPNVQEGEIRPRFSGMEFL